MPTITRSVLHTFIAYLSTPNTTEKQVRIERMRRKLAQRKTMDRLCLQQNLYLSINNDVTDAFVFINACQHADRRIKFLGYTGALQVRNADELLMMVNTLKKDMERGDILAVRYLANALEVPIEDIRNEIRFECTREMLVLFYKLYRMDGTRKDGNDAFEDGSERDGHDDEDRWVNDSSAHQAEHKESGNIALIRSENVLEAGCVKKEAKTIYTEFVGETNSEAVKYDTEQCTENNNIANHGVKVKSSADRVKDCMPSRNIPRSALDILRKNFDKYNTLNKVKQVIVKYPHKPPISLQPTAIRGSLSDRLSYHTNFKRFYSLKVQPDDMLNDILFIKLQIMLDLDGDIKLNQTEQVFLLTLFRESEDNILKTKIVQVVTRTHNIKKNKEWIGEISSRLKFPGLYKMSADQVAVVLECLRFMVRHGVAIPDVNVFLYRLMHSYQNNFVFFALDVLRTYRVFDRQVIDKCLRMEIVDHLAYDTLFGNISKRTARFAFEKMEKTLMLFSDDKNVQKIVRKIIEKGSDRLLVSIIRNYPNIGYFYGVLREIKDKTKLREIRDFLAKHLNIYGVDLICQLFEMNAGYDLSKHKSRRYYDTTEDDGETYEVLERSGEEVKNSMKMNKECESRNGEKTISNEKNVMCATNVTARNVGVRISDSYGYGEGSTGESWHVQHEKAADKATISVQGEDDNAVNNEVTGPNQLEHGNEFRTGPVMDDQAKITHEFLFEEKENGDNAASGRVHPLKKSGNRENNYKSLSIDRVNREYTDFYKKGLKVITQATDKERLKVLDHLISVCLRYGDVQRNKKLLMKLLMKIDDEEVRGMIEKGIMYFDLVDLHGSMND
ncbi:hypothetical protein VCUG_02399 [Vavraia culicis subsp. floridensis]|uniref:Uncharacterized protein n=1 Tax=Vavraia culicis (isolate floridensis) TaxID=948595 RepID=L2GSP4_VAVCU|nr:uncharacterized protein VCUG_02399 [Vavraia culicis subsp. floridensis]ELA46115.1 hypothetical protein VCUG_02399 [Vavraia culicis subsp. floridensis]